METSRGIPGADEGGSPPRTGGKTGSEVSVMAKVVDPKADPKAAPAPAAAAQQPTAEQANGAAAPEKEKGPKPMVCATAEAAVEEASKRMKGPRRAFTIVDGTVTKHVVAYNVDQASRVFLQEKGATIQEVGKEARIAAAKPVGVEAVLAAISSMPEEERNRIKEQLKGLLDKK